MEVDDGGACRSSRSTSWWLSKFSRTIEHESAWKQMADKIKNKASDEHLSMGP